MSDAVRVDGLPELRKALRGVEMGPAQLKAATKKAADIVVPGSKRRARKKSGRMAGSVRASGQQAGAVIRAGSAAIPYAGVQHYGWDAHNISPNPFLVDELAAKEPQVVRTIQGEFDALIKKNGL